MRTELKEKKDFTLKDGLGAALAVILFAAVMFGAAVLPGLISDPSSTVPEAVE